MKPSMPTPSGHEIQVHVHVSIATEIPLVAQWKGSIVGFEDLSVCQIYMYTVTVDHVLCSSLVGGVSLSCCCSSDAPQGLVVSGTAPHRWLSDLL